MALTRDFKETIQARMRRDHVFPKERLREGIEGPALPFNSRDSV